MLPKEIRSLAFAHVNLLDQPESKAILPSLLHAEDYVEQLLNNPIVPRPTYREMALAVISCDTQNANNLWKAPLIRVLTCAECKLYFTSADSARCSQCKE